MPSWGYGTPTLGAAPKSSPAPAKSTPPPSSTPTTPYQGSNLQKSLGSTGGTTIGSGGAKSVAPSGSLGKSYSGGGGSSYQPSSSQPTGSNVVPSTTQQSTNAVASRDVPVNPLAVNQLPQNVLANAINAQMQSRIKQQDRYDTPSSLGMPKKDTRSSAYGRVSQGIGTESDKPATREELLKAYKATGKEVYNPDKYYKDRTVGYGTKIGGYVPSNQFQQIPTRLETRQADLTVDKLRGDNEINKARTLVTEEAKQQADSIYSNVISERDNSISQIKNELQGKLDAGQINEAEANRILNDKVASINNNAEQIYSSKIEELNKQAQEKFIKNLESNKEYQASTKSYEQKAKSYGGRQEGSRITFDDLNKPLFDTRTKYEKLMDFERTILNISPLAPATMLANAPTELVLVPGQGGKGMVIEERLTKPQSFSPKDILASGYGQAAMGSVLLLAGGGILVKGAKNAINQERAITAFNEKVLSGKFKPTKSFLDKGLTKIKYLDFDTMKPATTQVKLVPKEVLKVTSFLEKKQDYLRNLGLKEYKNVKYASVGTVEEQALIKEQITSTEPNIINKINNIEIGKWEGLSKSGKVDKGYLIKGTQQVGDKNSVIAYFFKSTKSGKVKSVRAIALQDENAIILKPASPSQMLKQKVNVPGNINPIEIEGINRMKGLKVLKTRTISNIQEEQTADKIIRNINKQGASVQVGKNVKGTLSEIDIVNYMKGEGNIAYTKTMPQLISKGKAIRLEVLDSIPQDIMVSSSDEFATISKKVGTKRSGLSQEIGISESVTQPIPFTKLPKEGKFVPLKDMTGSPIKINEITKVIKNVDKPIKYTETNILPDYPKMVGGEGSTSLYSFDKQFGQLGGMNVNRVDAVDSEMSNIIKATLKTYTTSSPIMKAISLKGDLVNLPKYGGVNMQIREREILGPIKENALLLDKKTINKRINIPVRDNELLKLSRRDLMFSGVSEQFNKQFSQLKVQQAQITKVQQRQFNAQAQAIKLQIPLLQKPSFDFNPPKFDLPGFDIGLPHFPGSSGAGSPSRKQLPKIRTKFSSKYTASLGAAFAQAKPLEVTREQYERLNKAVYSGVEARPVLAIKQPKIISKVNF